VGLAPSDPKPAKITIREAYERIRVWYQTNISHVSDIDSRAKACLELVERLPEEGNLSDIEIRAVLLNKPDSLDFSPKRRSRNLRIAFFTNTFRYI
jgi:hypothetical protein